VSARRGGDDKRCVLVADDDLDILDVLESALEIEGYDVARATTADEARACFREAAGAVDVLVVDGTLDGAPGPVLAAELRTRVPRLGVIVITGSDPELLEQDRTRVPQMRVLQKPFRLQTLTETVRELVRAGGSRQPDPP